VVFKLEYANGGMSGYIEAEMIVAAEPWGWVIARLFSIGATGSGGVDVIVAVAVVEM
jgi:hypothetical protein